MTFHRITRAVRVCAIASAALAGAAGALAGPAAEQTDALQTQAMPGGQTALETLMSEAQSGSKYAQNDLGVLYDKGQGMPKDYGQAAQWFRKAAQQEYADGQYNLGVLYERGQGVPKDYAQAAQWYRKAAQQGHIVAQNNLGALYLNGRGVAQNKVAAYALYDLSASHDSSQDKIAFINRTLLSQKMTGQEIRAGEALRDQMNQPGNLLKALDEYLAASAADSRLNEIH